MHCKGFFSPFIKLQLAVLLVASLQAFATETKILWNTGHLYIEPSKFEGIDQAVIRFDDGTVLRIENLLVQEDKQQKKDVFVFSRIEPPTGIDQDTDIVEKDMATDYPLTDLDFDRIVTPFMEMPKGLGKGPVPGVTFAMNPTTQTLAWLFDPMSNIEVPNVRLYGRGESVLLFSRIQIGKKINELEWNIRLQRSPMDWGSSRPFFADRVGFTDEGRRLFAVDRAGSELYAYTYDWERRRYGEVIATQYLLPFHEGKVDFFLGEQGNPMIKSETGSVFYLEKIQKERQGRETNIRNTTEVLSVLPGGPATPANAWVDDLSDKRRLIYKGKELELIEWMHDDEAIERYLGTRAETMEKPPVVDVTSVADKWIKFFQFGNRAHDRSLTTVSAASMYGIPVQKNFMTWVSPAISEQFPAIRYEIAAQIFKAFRANRGQGVVSDVFYMKLTSANIKQLDRTIEAIKSHVYSLNSDDSNSSFLLVIDALDPDLPEIYSKMNWIMAHGLPSPTVKVAVLASPEKGTRTTYLQKQEQLPFEVCVDSRLVDDDFVLAVQSALKHSHKNLTTDVIKSLLHAIKSENMNWGQEFLSATKFADEVLFILNNANLDLYSTNIGLEIARVYNQLNGVRVVTFDRQVGDRINQLYDRLSVNGSKPVEEPLMLLDYQIKYLRDFLKEKRSQKQLPVLPIMFFGPPGTGKTLLTKLTAEELGAVVEMFNVGTLTNPKSGGELNLRPIEQKIQALHLKPGLKILILEEVDKVPAIYTHLNAALDPEQKTKTTLNLDGLIVLMTANSRKETERFRRLSAVRTASLTTEEKKKEYNDLKFDVNVESLSGGNEEEKQNAEALVGRFFKGIIMVPSLQSLNDEEKDEVLGHVIKMLEKEQNISLIVKDSARQSLKKTLDENQKGNFRTAIDALKGAVRLALTNYTDDHPGEKISGHFILNEERNLDNISALRMDRVEGSATVIANLVRDDFANYHRTLAEAADEYVQTLEEELRRLDNSDAGISHLYWVLKSFAGSMRIISKTALLNQNAVVNADSVIHLFLSMPSMEGLTHARKSEVRALLEKSFEPFYLNLSKTSPLPANDLEAVAPKELAAKVFSLVLTLDKLRERESHSFVQWAQAVIKQFNEVSAEKLNVDLKATNATAVLAAIISSEMGRQYAKAELKKFIPKDTLSTAVSKTTLSMQAAIPIAAATAPKAVTKQGPARSEKCDDFLKSLQDRLAKAKKIL